MTTVDRGPGVPTARDVQFPWASLTDYLRDSIVASRLVNRLMMGPNLDAQRRAEALRQSEANLIRELAQFDSGEHRARFEEILDFLERRV